MKNARETNPGILLLAIILPPLEEWQYKDAD